MQEERGRVLGLVAEGRISVEEADQLLAALEERTRRDEQATPAPPPRPRPTADAPRAERGQGGRKLSFDQLVQLGIHGIDPDFVKRVRHRFPDLSFDRLIEFGIHGVDVDYLEDVQDVLPDLDPGELLQMAIHGIDASYIREIRRRLPEVRLTADQLTQLAIHGIDPELIDALAGDIADLGDQLGGRPEGWEEVGTRFVRTPRAPRPPRPPRPPRAARPARPARAARAAGDDLGVFAEDHEEGWDRPGDPVAPAPVATVADPDDIEDLAAVDGEIDDRGGDGDDAPGGSRA